MSIEVIPTGSSAVVSDDCARDVALMAAVKDAEADLERSGGLHFGNIERSIGRVEADLERSAGLHYGDTVKTIKDAEADLERSGGFHYGDTVKTVKDSEANLERSSGTRYGNTLEAVKSSEANLERLAANRFAQTTRDIKDSEIAVERSFGVTRDVVRQSEIATEAAKAKVIDTVRKAELHAERGESHTRSLMAGAYADLKNSVFNSEKELGYSTLQGFKDQQMVSYQLAAAADKTACQNAAGTQLGFAIADKDRAIHATNAALAYKDMELRQERFAAIASKEATYQYCDLKETIKNDGQKTRDLLVQSEVDRLRERAMRAENQLAYLTRERGSA